MKSSFEIPEFEMKLNESESAKILKSELNRQMPSVLKTVKAKAQYRTGEYREGLDYEIVGNGEDMFGEIYQTDESQNKLTHLLEDGHVIVDRNHKVHGFVHGTKHFQAGATQLEKEWGKKYMTADKLTKAVDIKID